MSVLVTEITPDDKVMSAMNEINSSKRLKEAAVQRAEGEKIIKVKQAEAEAESMHLSGIGVAKRDVRSWTALRKALCTSQRRCVRHYEQGCDGFPHPKPIFRHARHPGPRTRRQDRVPPC